MYESPTNNVTTYSWDYENRTSVIEFPDNSLVTYLYDPNNQQDEYVVQKQTGAETIKYFWDNQNILQEYDVTTEAQYNYQPQAYGNLISQYRDADSSYYHYDGNFSTAALTDSTETESDSYSYTAFGETTNNTGTTQNPFTYKGQIGYYQDEHGLQLLRNRRYSPDQARFISEDPIGLDSGESNFYSYVANNPVNDFDPEGLAGRCSKSHSTVIINLVDDNGNPISVYVDKQGTAHYSSNGGHVPSGKIAEKMLVIRIVKSPLIYGPTKEVARVVVIKNSPDGTRYPRAVAAALRLANKLRKRCSDGSGTTYVPSGATKDDVDDLFGTSDACSKIKEWFEKNPNAQYGEPPVPPVMTRPGSMNTGRPREDISVVINKSFGGILEDIFGAVAFGISSGECPPRMPPTDNFIAEYGHGKSANDKAGAGVSAYQGVFRAADEFYNGLSKAKFVGWVYKGKEYYVLYRLNKGFQGNELPKKSDKMNPGQFIIGGDEVLSDWCGIKR
ncbi:MAG: RHS repeat-associated core domain-containing protein [Planctomycetaceae bacterium]|nr:RHS repeat-associated core domain-containing protein [Planctomycetaceae bacterium]